MAGSGQVRIMPDSFDYQGTPTDQSDQVGTYVVDRLKVHGTAVSSKIIGRMLGVAKRATMLVTTLKQGGPAVPADVLDAEKQVEELLGQIGKERILAACVFFIHLYSRFDTF